MSNYLSEYREAFDPETRASRGRTGPRAAVPGIRAPGATPDAARPAELHTAPRDEWADAYASPIRTPDWRLCRHQTIRETSIGGVLTNRECIDCSTKLPDRSWED